MQVENPPVIGGSAASQNAAEDSLASHGMYRIGLAYGRTVYRVRWFIITFWIIVLAISTPFASKVSTVLNGGGFSFQGSESSKVDDITINNLNFPKSQTFIVLHSNTDVTTTPNYTTQIVHLEQQVRNFQHVTSVTTGGVGSDGKTTYLTVNFDQNPDKITQDFTSFRQIITNNSDGPAKVYLTGTLAIYDEFTVISNKDIENADSRALPIAGIVLLFVFGTVVSALMPLLLAAVAVPVALAIIYVIALHTSTSVSVLSIASVIGLGLSIDYSLFMVRRYREELALGRERADAIGWTIATAGEAILFSGLIVMIGFSGMLLIGVPFMSSIGIAGVSVVICAVLAALTLLPATLGVLGPRINALRLPLVGRSVPTQQNDVGSANGFWRRLAEAVMRRPIFTIVGVAIVLVSLGWPVLSIQLGTPGVGSLPADSEARQGITLLQQQVPSTNSNPIFITAQTTDGSAILTADNLNKLNAFTQWASQQSHISSTISLTQLPAIPGSTALTPQQLIGLYTSGKYQNVPSLVQLVAGTTHNGTTLMTLTSNAALDSTAGKAVIDTLRSGRGQAQGLTILVGGTQATTLDFNRYLYTNFPRAIVFIIIATFLLLFLMFRSVLLPLKAVIVNILSISAAYGVIVWVFQFGNLQSQLGFSSEGFIEVTLPIIMFCILFGLSMDYEVFLLSRIREEWLRYGNNRYAVATGLEKTGSVITSAALLLVIVAGAITFTTLISTKEIGLGIAVAVLVDSTIIRTLLVPATMRLLGRWNWWLPGRPLPIERPAPKI